MKTKVFGIGFHKTGTKSLAAALARMGFSVTGPNNFRDPDIASTYREVTADLSRQYDAFQDNPWPLVYREMDRQWPEARFILTVRDSAQWFESQLQHFKGGSTPMRELVYGPGFGDPRGHREHYIQRVEMHNLAVRTYFQDRPGKLLEMNIVGGDGWDKLCGFLGVPVPDRPFPHKNHARRRARLARLRARRAREERAAREAGPENS